MNVSLLSQLISAAPRARRALLVSGSPQGTAPELVQLLAQQAAFVVAVDSGGEELRNAGVHPALILGDFDSVSPQTLEHFRAKGVESVTYDAYKDSSDLELALSVLRQRGFETVIATNVLGGRIDHELAALGNLAAFAERGTRVVLAEENESCVFLSAFEGCAESALELEFSSAPAPSVISLIPWGGEAVVSIQGVEWELDHATLVPASSRGVSNVVASSRVAITVHKGTAIVVLQLGQ